MAKRIISIFFISFLVLGLSGIAMSATGSNITAKELNELGYRDIYEFQLIDIPEYQQYRLDYLSGGNPMVKAELQEHQLDTVSENSENYDCYSLNGAVVAPNELGYRDIYEFQLIDIPEYQQYRLNYVSGGNPMVKDVARVPCKDSTTS